METKQCSKCKIIKPAIDFWAHPATRDKLQPRCKKCMTDSRDKEWAKKYQKEWCKKNSEWLKEYRKQNSEKIKGYARTYNKKHRRKITAKRYGLKLEQYDQMLEEQNGKCAVCLSVSKKLVIDHDHKTNKIRKLLCPKCNTLLGLCNDNKNYLKKLINYLAVADM